MELAQQWNPIVISSWGYLPWENRRLGRFGKVFQISLCLYPTIQPPRALGGSTPAVWPFRVSAHGRQTRRECGSFSQRWDSPRQPRLGGPRTWATLAMIGSTPERDSWGWVRYDSAPPGEGYPRLGTLFRFGEYLRTRPSQGHAPSWLPYLLGRVPWRIGIYRVLYRARFRPSPLSRQETQWVILCL